MKLSLRLRKARQDSAYQSGKVMEGILFAAQVEGLRSRKDKTVAITLGSQELSPEKAGKLFIYRMERRKLSMQ